MEMQPIIVLLVFLVTLSSLTASSRVQQSDRPLHTTVESSPDLDLSHEQIILTAVSDDLYRINADGSNPIKLTQTGGNFFPKWSPDGKHIAFESDRDHNDHTAEIYIMDADGSNQTRLTKTLSGSDYPTWSPDSK